MSLIISPMHLSLKFTGNRVQRFGPREHQETDDEAAAAGGGARSQARVGARDAELPNPKSARVRETRGNENDDVDEEDDDDDDDGTTIWKGDFGS